MTDLIIRNAMVIDGSGSSGFMADIAVDQGRIAGIGADLGTTGTRTIDVEGLAVCPGFIDMHSHSDWTIAAYPSADSKIHQGVTTEVVGNCGSTMGPVVTERFQEFVNFVDCHGGLFSLPEREKWQWPDLTSYYKHLAARGLSVNIAPLVGQGALRCAVMGFEPRKPAPDEIRAMQMLLQKEIDQGLFGMSAGLIYHPGAFAGLEELTALAQIVKRADGLFTLHMRSESHGITDAIQEALAIAERSGVSLEISHLKCELPANWGRSAEILALLDEARGRGVSVDFDQYPYTAYSCSLLEIFPPWAKDQGATALIKALQNRALRRQVAHEITQPSSDWENPIDGLGWDMVRINGFKSDRYRAFDGRDLTAISTDLNLSPTETLFRLFEEESGGLAMIVFSMCEEDLERIMQHPATMIGSDGASLGAHGALGDRMIHPRSYGTFPRVLGRYVRQRKTLSLETAVSKMSGLPARKLGLSDRGLIREGYVADLVVFDPDAVADAATFDAPHRFPVGIHHVIVNGQIVVEDGEHTGLLPGTLLLRSYG